MEFIKALFVPPNLRFSPDPCSHFFLFIQWPLIYAGLNLVPPNSSVIITNTMDPLVFLPASAQKPFNEPASPVCHPAEWNDSKLQSEPPASSFLQVHLVLVNCWTSLRCQTLTFATASLQLESITETPQKSVQADSAGASWKSNNKIDPPY